MNPTLIKIAQFLARRPKDRTIRMFRIVSGVIIMLLLWWSRDRSVLDIPFWGALESETEQLLEYVLIGILGIPLILRGISTSCLFRNKTLRILQGLLGFFLILIGGPIMDPLVKNIITAPSTTTGGFQIDTTAAPIVEMTWHPGIFLVLLGIIWIFVGLTGKGTTSKCIHHGEVVKKIRV